MSKSRPASSLKRRTRAYGTRYVVGALVRIVKVLHPNDCMTNYVVGDVGCITHAKAGDHGIHVKFFRDEANGPHSGHCYVFREEMRLVRKVKDESAIQEG